MKASNLATLALVFAMGATATGCCNKATTNCRVTYMQDTPQPTMQLPDAQSAPLKVPSFSTVR